MKTPEGSTEVLRQRQLKALLDQKHARLVVVHGPAGYGKTTLLRQYADEREKEGGQSHWIYVDQYVSDPAHLIRRLCELVADGQNVGAPSLQEFARLAKGLPDNSLVILDSLEQGGTAHLDALISQAIRVLPSQVQLCLSTRALPSIDLPGMQIREEAIVLKAADLRFSLGETVEFLREFKSLAMEEVEALHRNTDGWPAALQCVRLCMRAGKSGGSAALAGDGMTQELMDFLTSSVFEALDSTLRQVLLIAAVPERICGPLLETLGDFKDGAALLKQIEAAGLFLTPLDTERRWFGFHVAFRQFLKVQQRSRLAPAQLDDLLFKTAQWCARHDMPEDAVSSYLAAGKYAEAADELDGVIDGLLAEERLTLIARSVAPIPDDILIRHTNILIAGAIAYAFLRDYGQCEHLLGLRKRALEEAGAPEADWQTYRLARAFLLAAQDEIEQMGAEAQDNLKSLTSKDGLCYSVSLNAAGFHLAALSRFDESLGYLQKARPVHDAVGSMFGQAYQEGIRSAVISAQGRISDAVKGLKSALVKLEQDSSSAASSGAVVAAYLAHDLYEMNCLNEAEALVGNYLQTVERQAIVDPLAMMIITSARISVLKGEPGLAEEVLERGIYLGHRHKLPRLTDYALCELARMATLSGNSKRAAHHLAEVTDKIKNGTDTLLFHASEAEASAITRARHLIQIGDHGEARSLLQNQIRIAKGLGRTRRLLKLHLLLAISLNETGETNLARRSFLSALEIGALGGFVRSFLDEGQAVMRLLKETLTSLASSPDLPTKDDLAAYIQTLLKEAGAAVGPVETALAEEDFPDQLFEELTERERDILTFVAQGYSNRALADRLSLSTNTVKWHLRNIFEKLHIKNRMQAVLVARHFGLVE